MTRTPPIHRIPSISVVFFGPAHAGKSTLIGYLADKLCDDVNAEYINRQVSRDYPRYDASAYYAYVVDTGKDEILRDTEHAEGGTTKRLHFKRIPQIPVASSIWPYMDIVLVDTPGASTRYRSKIKGLNFGEIGAFVVEAKELIKIASEGPSLLTLVGFITPLRSWLSLASKPKTLVILSKGDTSPVAYSALLDTWWAAFNRYVRADPASISIIITEIHVKEHSAKNVFEDSLSSVLKEPLWTVITTCAAAIVTDTEEELSTPRAVFIVDRKFPAVKGFGPAFRGKMIAGKFAVSDEIRLLPLLNDDKTSAPDGWTTKIRSLQQVDGDSVDMISRGDIGGIVLAKKMRGLKLTRGTIAISLETHYVTGNCLAIECDPGVSASAFRLLQEYGVLWFGRVIWGNAIAVMEHTVTLELKPATQIVAMPTLPTGEYMFPDGVITVDITMKDLIKGRLLRLGYVVALGTSDASFPEEPLPEAGTDWSAWVKSHSSAHAGGESPHISHVKWREQ